MITKRTQSHIERVTIRVYPTTIYEWLRKQEGLQRDFVLDSVSYLGADGELMAILGHLDTIEVSMVRETEVGAGGMILVAPANTNPPSAS